MLRHANFVPNLGESLHSRANMLIRACCACTCESENPRPPILLVKRNHTRIRGKLHDVGGKEQNSVHPVHPVHSTDDGRLNPRNGQDGHDGQNGRFLISRQPTAPSCSKLPIRAVLPTQRITCAFRNADNRRFRGSIAPVCRALTPQPVARQWLASLMNRRLPNRAGKDDARNPTGGPWGKRNSSLRHACR